MNTKTKAYNPDDYAPDKRLEAYLAAGSPLQTEDGRHLTTRGEIYVAEDAATKKTTYDASKYAQRGDGMQAWINAGRPPYDSKGRELDPAGWPTGRMEDGSRPTDAPAEAPNLVGGSVAVVLVTPTSTASLPYRITEAGDYWLSVGEQPDQKWVLNFAGSEVSRGLASSDEATPFFLDVGTGSLEISFSAESVSPEQLAKREADGQGVSKQHYTLRQAR